MPVKIPHNDPPKLTPNAESPGKQEEQDHEPSGNSLWHFHFNLSFSDVFQ